MTDRDRNDRIGIRSVRYTKKKRRLTLGLDKDTLVYTGLEGTVEEGVEHGVAGIELVVGLDILLQALTAVNDMLAN